ncbi:MAG: phage baseplate assembly protein V [Pseudomonadota bacterium]
MPISPAFAASGIVTVEILADGETLPDTFQIVQVTTHSALNEIPHASITFAGENIAEGNFLISDSDLIKPGRRMEIRASYEDAKPESLFKGVITNNTIEVLNGGLSLQIDAVASAFKLDGTPKDAQFQNLKDSEIMAQIIEAAGLSSAVAPTPNAAENCLQLGLTDWQFLLKLARRNGQVLVCNDDTVSASALDLSAEAALVVTLGDDLLDITCALKTERLISAAKGKTWDAQAQEVLSVQKSVFADLKWGDEKPKTLAKLHGARVEGIIDMNGTLDTLGIEAAARTTESSLTAITGSCRFAGSAMARAGDMLDLKGVPQRFGGRALIDTVTHRIEEGTWTTAVGLGRHPMYIEHGVGDDAPAPTLQIGKVTQLQDDPAVASRIQVNLPMIGPMIGEGGASVWARMAAPYASNDAGIQFLPEIDDEVVVAFLGGGGDVPVILGALHNGKSARARDVTDDNFAKVIKTKAGLNLSFDDDKTSVTLATPGGHKLVLSDDMSEVSLEDSNGNKILLNADGISIDSAKDLSLKAVADATLEASSDVVVSGGASIDINAGSTLTARSGASSELSSAGSTTITGAIVNIN